LGLLVPVYSEATRIYPFALRPVVHTGSTLKASTR